MSDEWMQDAQLYCPLCMAHAMWTRERGVYYCVGCDRRFALNIFDTISLSASEQDELTAARLASGCGSNSAVGAFS